MTNKTFAAEFDPIQRSEQWKRRVDREENVLCPPPPPGLVDNGPSADLRLDMLQQTLQGGGRPLSSARSSMISGVHPISGTPRVPSSAGVRATAGTGRFIVQTPRLNTGGTASSRGVSGIGGSASETSSILRAELEAETRKRHAAEQELQRLKAMLAANNGV
mmetsp:Transcript_5476/g.16283  ORF Transcript_5476/g.16283 Transcript_5476/m.16283 type:complete len:162 (+) Transcript_5476:83-568(+)